MKISEITDKQLEILIKNNQTEWVEENILYRLYHLTTLLTNENKYLSRFNFDKLSDVYISLLIKYDLKWVCMNKPNAMLESETYNRYLIQYNPCWTLLNHPYLICHYIHLYNICNRCSIEDSKIQIYKQYFVNSDCLDIYLSIVSNYYSKYINYKEEMGKTKDKFMSKILGKIVIEDPSFLLLQNIYWLIENNIGVQWLLKNRKEFYFYFNEDEFVKKDYEWVKENKPYRLKVYDQIKYSTIIDVPEEILNLIN